MHIKKRQIPAALDEAYLLFQRGAFQQAQAILHAVVKADHRQPDALHLLGLIEGHLGVFDSAEEYLVRAIKTAPNEAEYHNSLGVVLRKQGKLTEAERSYRRCLKFEPDHVEALNNLGTLLRHTHRPDEAVPWCRRTVQLKPNDDRFQANLAGALAEQGQVAEAKKILLKLVARNDPRIRLTALTGLMSVALSSGDVSEYLRLHQKVLEEYDPDYELTHYLFYLNYLDTISPAEISKRHSQFAARITKSSPNQSTEFRHKIGGERLLRIGYLSPDLTYSSVGKLLEPVIRCHDKQRVYTVLYDIHTAGKMPLASLKDTCDLWRNCRELSDAELIDLVRNDDIDILVDLVGYGGGNRIAIYANRLAPVQVSWLGYFNTTGLPQVDWIVSDRFSTPHGEEQLYVERTWRLPFFRFPVMLPRCDTHREPALRPKGPVTFVSNNNLLKITQSVLAAWVRILQQLPEATLVVRWMSFMSQDIRQAFTERFVAAGGEVRQLRVAEPIEGHQDFLSSYDDVDIMLDTFPFCGGVTTLEALAMGVPVVALAGDRMAGRQSQAFLELAGHKELVAKTVDSYVDLAVALAKDPERLATLRETLHHDLYASPLGDAVGFTRALEDGYRAMWEDWCQSNP